MSLTNSINDATMQVADQMLAHDEVRNSVSGPFGDFLRTAGSAAVGIFMAGNALAMPAAGQETLGAMAERPAVVQQETPGRFESRVSGNRSGLLGTTLGGLAGALVGNQVGQGNGKVAATALGAVVGAQAGNFIEGPGYPQQQYPQQQYQQQYPQQGYATPNEGDGVLTGAAIGTVAGGIIGNQFGKGNGKTAMTVAGAIGGLFLGAGTTMAVNRRDAINAGYGQAPAAQNGLNGYRPPVYATPNGYNGPHPMSNYAPAFFAQMQGQAAPTKPLSPEAAQALDYGFRQITEQYGQTQASQQVYGTAYDAAIRSKQGQYNPYYNMSGSQAQVMQQQAYEAERRLGQASRDREMQEKKYMLSFMRILDAGEMAARNGEDITPYRQYMQYMSLPLVDRWNYRNPMTGQNVEVQTAPRPQMGR